MSNGFEIFPEPNVVAMKFGEKIVDLATEIPSNAQPTPIYSDTQDGRDLLRHSCAHVLAQAVQKLYPSVKLGIGPVIVDGFYYDFMSETPFTPEDLKLIKKEMDKIIRSAQRFSRRELSLADAKNELDYEPLKLELIEDFIAQADGDDSTIVSIYDNVDKNTGETIWKDLCRGPHIPSARILGNGWGLTSVSSAYWKADESNAQMQRIYGTAWESKEALQEYKDRVAEAEKRDHRKLGQELDLFSFPEEIGSGLVVFHPKGGILRKTLEDYSRNQHERSGYEFVYTPHISKSNLFSTSGHLQWYADGMYPPMKLDEVLGENGAVVKPATEYYMKPMNCPFHNLIYKSQPRSYRDLPLRLFEFGTVYRYEKSGTMHGLTRVRSITQDDSHIYVAQDQVAGELKNTLDFVLNLLRDYGLNDFYIELSTKEDGNNKFIGSDELWAEATKTLETVAINSGIELVSDPGGAAFYGPKISVQARDAIGRTWQMSTIQLDFNLPERFDLLYTASDGSRQRPVMIHRALFGSIERFFAVLTEHYAGAFPLWLAPEQVVGVPVSDDSLDYLYNFVDQLKSLGVRASVDSSSDRMQKKIRTISKRKVPIIIIVGDEDRANGTVSFRFRDGSQLNGVPLKDAVDKIVKTSDSREQVDTAWQDLI